MKQPENKKNRISLSEEQLPVFWVQSLRFSMFKSFNLKQDLTDLTLSAKVFLTLRDFGVTGILYVFIYDLIKLLKHDEKTLVRRYESPEAMKINDSVNSDDYKFKFLNVFKVAKQFNKLKKLFSKDEVDPYKFAIYFEQLFEGLSNFSSFYFFAPEYDLMQFDADLENIFTELQNHENNLAETSVELGFEEDLNQIFAETVEFLAMRLSAHSEIDQFVLDTDKINEIKHASLFIKKSVRTQKRLIEKISQSLQTINVEEIARDEQTQDFIEADDAFYYPRGGINELTRKGSFESILPSELAFIDEAVGEDENSADMFSLRYAENEILYFQRDDGYIRRKHYAVNIVLWDFLSFRKLIPELEHTFDVYLESAIHRFIKDFMTFANAKGLKLNIYWVYKNDNQEIESPELFKQMFFDYENLGVLENTKIADADDVLSLINSNSKESWIIVLPFEHENVHFPSFSDFSEDITQKSGLTLIKFTNNSKLSNIDKITDKTNLHELIFDSENETANCQKVFESFVNLLFKIII